MKELEELTGSTDTKIVASKATMSEMTAMVIITPYSSFPAVHSSSLNSPVSSRESSTLDKAVMFPASSASLLEAVMAGIWGTGWRTKTENKTVVLPV